LSYLCPLPEGFCRKGILSVSRIHNAFQGFGHLKFFKMAAGRHLGFDPTANGALRSAVPENPTVEPNMKGISCAAELWPFEMCELALRSVGRLSVVSFILLTLMISYTAISLR